MKKAGLINPSTCFFPVRFGSKLKLGGIEILATYSFFSNNRFREEKHSSKNYTFTMQIVSYHGLTWKVTSFVFCFFIPAKTKGDDRKQDANYCILIF